MSRGLGKTPGIVRSRRTSPTTATAPPAEGSSCGGTPAPSSVPIPCVTVYPLGAALGDRGAAVRSEGRGGPEEVCGAGEALLGGGRLWAATRARGHAGRGGARDPGTKAPAGKRHYGILFHTLLKLGGVCPTDFAEA